MNTINYRPINLARWVLWGGTAALFCVLPLIFKQGFAITLMSSMGTMIIFALAYNMLLGQTGMLSFGHAVFAGLGSFFAIHAMNWMTAGKLPVSITLLPLVGGFAGALFGLLFGYLITKRAGTPFAMITMGIGEMVFAMSLMFPKFFGGEGGISGNRVIGEPLFGFISYGPSIQVYYLIVLWVMICMAAMYAFTQTPLGRMANAVRDNPERVQFIGYDTRMVRYVVLILSSFFAGVSGGLTAINFEIVSAENVGALRSGAVLLATFIGGAAFFFGPILGAIVFTFFAVALSEFTKAWQLYLGVFFVLMVMYAPYGLSGMLLHNLRVMKFKRFKPLLDPYLGLFTSTLVLTAGIVMAIEMGYHLTLEAANGTVMKLWGFKVDAAASTGWMLCLTCLIAGGLMFWHCRKNFSQAWDNAQAKIEEDLQREAL